MTYEAGLQALDPRNFSGPLWEQFTGIKSNVVELSHPDQYSKPVAEHIAASGAYLGAFARTVGRRTTNSSPPIRNARSSVRIVDRMSLPDLPQESVAFGVAERVVEQLEVVHVQDQQGSVPPASALHLRHELLEPIRRAFGGCPMPSRASLVACWRSEPIVRSSLSVRTATRGAISSLSSSTVAFAARRSRSKSWTIGTSGPIPPCTSDNSSIGISPIRAARIMASSWCTGCDHRRHCRNAAHVLHMIATTASIGQRSHSPWWAGSRATSA